MKKTWIFVVFRRLRVIAFLIAVFVPSVGATTPDHRLLSHADDYVFGFYPYGWRNRDANGDIVFAIQTPHYGILLNASKARITKTGTFRTRPNAETAAQLGNDKVLAPLAVSPLTFLVRIGDTMYEAETGAPNPDDVLIQRLGRYFAHIDVRDISLRTQAGVPRDDVRAELSIYAWSDHVRATFRVECADALSDVTIVARHSPAEHRNALRAVNLIPESQRDHTEGTTFTVETPVIAISQDVPASISIGLVPTNTQITVQNTSTVRAESIAPYTGALSVTRDPSIGWYQVLLGDNPDIWTMERVRVEVENSADSEETLHIAFSKRSGGFGITGMSPVLCDETGAPMGLPVQISKNWHVSPPWFDGIAMLRLAPRAKHTLEFRIAYAHWGGVPAVSHAQLALEGWGTHQLWDECALGSFGESICYDPDVNLGRAMIDDVRPLMVWGMGKQPQRKWSWTHNVGGGDFLVLERDGKRQYLGRQKTEYESQGPVLTTVRYSGETPDGAIQSHVTTQSWRSDDFVRGLYTLRYDVAEPVAFTRLAFFQLGADRYNHNLFTHLSRGDLDGVKETWTPDMGGKKYSRHCVPLNGEKPWIAVTGNTKNPPPVIKEDDQGAWADRGFIVHRWKARIGGKDMRLPHYSVFGTEDGRIPSAIVELSPPPGVAALERGDFVECVVEMVVLPQCADDYYGPNESFREALRDYGGNWRMVHREAVNTNIRARAETGVILSEWPVIVRAHHGKRASVTIEGGSGFIPLTIADAGINADFALQVLCDGEIQPMPPSAGKDWWQARYRPTTKSYDLIFTVPLTSSGPATITWSAASPQEG
ncbi:MAG: hypothetical protein HUU46_13490 [Candidatus Hydrogenedentes bacterium]|nr:hypothetical protein [Candidatus Hydrogenedentota bacterium]